MGLRKPHLPRVVQVQLCDGGGHRITDDVGAVVHATDPDCKKFNRCNRICPKDLKLIDSYNRSQSNEFWTNASVGKIYNSTK
jgi:hypothetical protein